jgi:hypothetical protein
MPAHPVSSLDPPVPLGGAAARDLMRTTKRSDQEIALGRRPARVSRIGQLAVAAEVPENPLDQGLLLDAFEADLRRGQEFGWFVADLLLSLGLLGTVIGFILMLAPISGLDTTDESAIKGALAAMSGGMAVALYTTLAGLIGGMLLKVQGFLLDGAVQEVVGRTTRLTEVFVLPALERSQPLLTPERMQHDAAA